MKVRHQVDCTARNINLSYEQLLLYIMRVEKLDGGDALSILDVCPELLLYAVRNEREILHTS